MISSRISSVLLIAMLLGLVACNNNLTQAESIPTLNPSLTPTPKPTDTPEPTNTRRPTSTLVPTNTFTPQPPATPEPTASATPILYSLAVSLFHDLHGNDSQEPDEPPVPGAIVSVADIDCTTDNKGMCELGKLPLGPKRRKLTQRMLRSKTLIICLLMGKYHNHSLNFRLKLKVIHFGCRPWSRPFSYTCCRRIVYKGTPRLWFWRPA